jgi:hypothetical protein
VPAFNVLLSKSAQVLTLEYWGHVPLFIHRATPDAHVSRDCVLQGKNQRRMAGTIDLLKEAMCFVTLEDFRTPPIDSPLLYLAT